MRNYYLHNGSEKKGPFTIDELKEQNITEKTPVWYKGLARWTEAKYIDELKELLSSMHEPFMETVYLQTQTEFPNYDSDDIRKKKKEGWMYMLLILLVIALTLGYLVLIFMNSGDVIR